MAKTARIILLNGVGSVGKGSIARALQAIATDPFLHVEMDAFIAMLPEKMYGHPDGLSFHTALVDGKPEVAITSGDVCQRCLLGMRHAVVAMATQGNNMIVDDVLTEGDGAQYEELLSAFEMHKVGVFAALDTLERREKERGDRMIGLARWQFDRVHQGMTYDLVIDSDRLTPMESAKLIRDRFGL